MANWRRWPWKLIALSSGVAFGVFIILGITLAGNDLPALPTQQGMDLYGGTMHGNKISTKSWTFDYTHAQLSTDGTAGTIQGIHNGVVYKNGKPYMHVTAQEITLNTQSLDFTATGKVVITRADPKADERFETDEMIWTNALHLMRLDHPSFLRTGNRVLKIGGAVIDFNKNTVHLNSVDGSVLIQHKPPQASH